MDALEGTERENDRSGRKDVPQDLSRGWRSRQIQKQMGPKVFFR
jgi:hypothetical protein